MKIPHLRWYIAVLLFLSTVINYIDRQTLSVVAPVLTKELHLSPVDYSNILTAFLAAYTIMYLGSGLLVDRWGTRKSLSIFMVWWSISNMCHAFTRTAMQLGAFRLLLGLGESGNFMAAVKAISEWYPAKERALVNGMVQAGAAVGAIVATPVVAWITVRFGWQTAFLATGSLGLFWLAAWLFFFYLPEHHPRITDAERDLVMADTTAPDSPPGKIQEKPRWIDLLQMRQTWGLLLSRFLSDPVWWFYLFWLPKYLVEQRGFTMIEMGMMAWLPYLTADAGSILGGLFSGWLIKRNWTVIDARVGAMLPFALMMPLSILVGFAPSRILCLTLISLVTFSHMAWKTNLVTLTNDIYPTRIVGSVAGLVAFGNGLGGTLFTYLTGWIVQYFGYNSVFIVMGFLHPLAFLLVRFLVRGELKFSEPSLTQNPSLA